ncbi:MAG: DUF2974 domain-containing protein [Oscillospiraceae bacterium]
MENIISYVGNELRTFDQKPFCNVDSLVLSQLAYVHFDGFVPPPNKCASAVTVMSLFKAEYFSSLFDGTRDAEKSRQMFLNMAASPRFRGIKICGYINKFDADSSMQFCAVTFSLGDDTNYIAFRGTDGTMVGWKEDFDMAFICPVPAQYESVQYINEIGGCTRGTLRVGGHSKGGNLAVYAAMKCSREVRDRVTDIYSHDGPGFRKEVIESADFESIVGRIDKTLPKSSVIGMLLQNHEKYSVVDSDRFWIMQHDPFSWEIDKDKFRVIDKISSGAQYINDTFAKWLSEQSDEKRQLFVNTLFNIMKSTNAETLNQITDNWARQIPTFYSAYKDLDEETKKELADLIKELAKIAIKNIGDDNKFLK